MSSEFDTFEMQLSLQKKKMDKRQETVTMVICDRVDDLNRPDKMNKVDNSDA